MKLDKKERRVEVEKKLPILSIPNLKKIREEIRKEREDAIVYNIFLNEDLEMLNEAE